jgi:Lipid-binding putative hydrolase
MRKIILAISSVVLISNFSCKKANLDPGTTIANKAAGGWWVTFTQGGTDVFGLGTFFLDTYNTAANGDSIWVDDLGHSWNFKVKAKIDYTSLSFATANAQNSYYNSQVTILNGKVLPKAGHSRTGNITDSIYFQAQFSDDPSGATYVISGTLRTGFIEDDY